MSACEYAILVVGTSRPLSDSQRDVISTTLFVIHDDVFDDEDQSERERDIDEGLHAYIPAVQRPRDRVAAVTGSLREVIDRQTQLHPPGLELRGERHRFFNQSSRRGIHPGLAGGVDAGGAGAAVRSPSGGGGLFTPSAFSSRCQSVSWKRSSPTTHAASRAYNLVS